MDQAALAKILKSNPDIYVKQDDGPRKLFHVKHSPGTVPRAESRYEAEFILIWESIDGQPLVRQHMAIPKRKYKFDFAHVATKVLIEIDDFGSHFRYNAMRRDRDKNNRATLNGWHTFSLVPSMMSDFAPLIKDFISLREKYDD